MEHKIRERLLSKFPKLTVLLKLGEHGCGIITKNDYYTVTAVTKINKKILDEFKIVDVTGAGKNCRLTCLRFQRILIKRVRIYL